MGVDHARVLPVVGRAQPVATGAGMPIPETGGALAPEAVAGWIRSAVDSRRGVTMTVRSLVSGRHLTYRLTPQRRASADVGVGTVVLVDLLTGPCNTSDYTLLGAVYYGRGTIEVLTSPRAPSLIQADAPSARTLHWLFGRLASGGTPAPVAEVWHDGTCARCGRPLTTPESVSLGLGPICAGRED